MPTSLGKRGRKPTSESMSTDCGALADDKTKSPNKKKVKISENKAAKVGRKSAKNRDVSSSD